MSEVTPVLLSSTPRPKKVPFSSTRVNGLRCPILGPGVDHVHMGGEEDRAGSGVGAGHADDQGRGLLVREHDHVRVRHAARAQRLP